MEQDTPVVWPALPRLCLHFAVQTKFGQTGNLAPKSEVTQGRTSLRGAYAFIFQGVKNWRIVAVPRRIQKARNLEYSPVWRPFLLASFRSLTRCLEWTTAGFFMMRPSFSKQAIFRRELANEISLISLGSNQILRLPHLRTDAARRCQKTKLGQNSEIRETERSLLCA